MLPATCQAKISEAWEQLDDSHVQEAEIQSKQLGAMNPGFKTNDTFFNSHPLLFIYAFIWIKIVLIIFWLFHVSGHHKPQTSKSYANREKKIYVSCILILEPVLVFISHIWMIRVTLNQSL